MTSAHTTHAAPFVVKNVPFSETVSLHCPHAFPCHPRTGFVSSYTKVYSVIYDSGMVPQRAIFFPREITFRSGGKKKMDLLDI